MGREAEDLLPPAQEQRSAWRGRARNWGVLTAAVFGAFLLLGNHLDFPLPLPRCSKLTAEDVLRHSRLIDGHNDWAIWTRAFYNNHIYNENFTEDSTLYGQVDFPRLARGRLRGQFWSVYVGCPLEADVDNADDYGGAVIQTLQQIDLVRRLARRFPSRLSLHDSTSSFSSVPLSSGRVAGFLGVEGLHQIGNSAATLRLYHQLGVRYTTLTHTCNNRYADSEASKALHGGLSPAGREIVREMNRMGMAVDLSHTSSRTMRDALTVTRAPAMFSHSGAYSVFRHTRNVPDEVLLMLKENGGVVMATFYPEFLVPKGENASLENVVDHVLYIRDLIGYQHVGIGSDFDGMAAGPAGLEDVSKYPALVDALISKGLKRKEIEAIIGGNVLRVMKGVEDVAFRLREELPLEDDLQPFFNKSQAGIAA